MVSGEGGGEGEVDNPHWTSALYGGRECACGWVAGDGGVGGIDRIDDYASALV